MVYKDRRSPSLSGLLVPEKKYCKRDIMKTRSGKSQSERDNGSASEQECAETEIPSESMMFNDIPAFRPLSFLLSRKICHECRY
jgi:hypothetical protein